MRALAVCLLLLLWCAVLPAQEPADERDFHRELKELIEAHEADLRRQAATLQREAQVLRELAAAGNALRLPQFDLARTEALSKLDKAQRVAVMEPALTEPVPTVLERVQAVLAEAWPQPGDVARQKVLEALRPLEDHLWARSDTVANETRQLRVQAEKIHDLPVLLEIPSRNVWFALREARREAMKTP